MALPLIKFNQWVQASNEIFQRSQSHMFSLILINRNREMQSPVFFRNHQQYWTYGSKTLCTPNRQSIIVVMTNRRYTTWEWWVFEWSQFCCYCYCYCYCYCRTTVSPLFNRSTCWGARITIANSWLWSWSPTEDRRMDSWIYYCQVWSMKTSDIPRKLLWEWWVQGAGRDIY